MSEKTASLQQRHARHCLDDIAAVFGAAAGNLDYKTYARWLAEFRRINLEELPRLPLKRENLNVLFNRKVGDRFMEIYTSADTGRAEDIAQAAETFVLEDTRAAIGAALSYLQQPGNAENLRALAAAKMFYPGAFADNVLRPGQLPDEAELQKRIAARLALLLPG